jgi:cardiolipin synthase
MTNSRASNDFGAVSDAGRYFYDPLIEAGVKIHERVGSTLHSKTATFDGAFSIVGSANLNGRSKGRDSEFVLAVSSPDTAAQLERRFDQGLAQTQRVTAGELRNEGFFTNLKQWALSTLAWTF